MFAFSLALLAGTMDEAIFVRKADKPATAITEIMKKCRLRTGALRWEKGSARLNGIDISYDQAVCVFSELKGRNIPYPQAFVGKIS